MTENQFRNRFERRGNALVQATEDLVLGVLDASPAERAKRIRQFAVELAEELARPAPPVRCVGCRRLTAKATLVGVAELGTGPSTLLFACPVCLPDLAA